MDIFFPYDSNGSELVFPDIDAITNIYDHIDDSESKYIFINRLSFSLTKDFQYIHNIIQSIPSMKEFESIVNRPAFIYGAGRRGQAILEIYSEKKWLGFIDREKQGLLCGLEVSKLEDVSIRDELVVISNKYDYKIIAERLKGVGIPERQIVILSDYVKQMTDSIYFNTKCLSGIKKVDGLLCDIGSYDGLDSIRAIDYFSNSVLEILAFEPNKENYVRCTNNLVNYPSVRVFRLGVSSQNGKEYIEGSGEGAHLSDNGRGMVETVALDDFIGDKKVGFIKMDIEGEEENVLVGAEEIIKKNKPIIALSVYHKCCDIWRIPMKLLELNPDYKLFFSHHTLSWGDTVCYAVNRD